MRLKNILNIVQQYPYRGMGALQFVDYLWLKCFTVNSFPSMSIIPEVKNYFQLSSDEEFRVRYYLSRIGFEEIWTSKDRTTRESIESFYNEHDKDLWRQAYLSKNQYIYKKKLLYGYHIASTARAIRVLDYGCGTSAFGHYLKRKGFSVDAADIPSPTLAFVRAQMGFGNVYTIGKDTVPENTYDFISCLDALEHTFTPLQITTDLLKSLKTGGIFYVTFPIEKDFDTPNCSHPHTREAQIERPAVFTYLREICEEIVPEAIYRKR